jgi:hypothetical protein
MTKLHSVCLVIDSDYPFPQHYKKQRNLWRQMMNLDPEIKCYFIRLSESITEELIVNEEDNTIYVRGKESYIPGILIKTLKAMQYVFNKYDFKYLIRTNISTFWNFKLYKQKFNIGLNNLVEAAVGYINSDPFPSGMGIVMSRNIILKMITAQNQFDFSLYDDVAIGKFLQANNIPINNIHTGRYQFISPLSHNEILSKIHTNINKAYQFRVVYDRGPQDNFIWQNLYNLLYGKANRYIL